MNTFWLLEGVTGERERCKEKQTTGNNMTRTKTTEPQEFGT